MNFRKFIYEFLRFNDEHKIDEAQKLDFKAFRRNFNEILYNFEGDK